MPRYSSLPAVGSLVVFEAVARRQSFTLASEELSVTQGAVSHHIKSLEKKLGVLLFLRLPRRTVLTADGERFAQAVRDGLDSITETAKALRSRRKSPVLNVTVLSSFAFKWLFPRLLRFEELNPGIELRFNTTDELVDLAAGDSDAAIRYGGGRYPGLHVEQVLGEETMVPVCSPALLDHGPPLWRRVICAGNSLHDDSSDRGGNRGGIWPVAAGVKLVDLGAASVRLAAGDHQAAPKAWACSAGHPRFWTPRRGPLVSPSDRRWRRFNYHFVCPRERPDEPKLARFQRGCCTREAVYLDRPDGLADSTCRHARCRHGARGKFSPGLYYRCCSN